MYRTPTIRLDDDYARGVEVFWTGRTWLDGSPEYFVPSTEPLDFMFYIGSTRIDDDLIGGLWAALQCALRVASTT
jgi:hypothetical protein